jgi:hypothetical protein
MQDYRTEGRFRLNTFSLIYLTSEFLVVIFGVHVEIRVTIKCTLINVKRVLHYSVVYSVLRFRLPRILHYLLRYNRPLCFLATVGAALWHLTKQTTRHHIPEDSTLLNQRSQIFWEIVGLEGGPLSLVSITEELLEWTSSDSGSRKSRLTAGGICCADHATPSIRKSWH